MKIVALEFIGLAIPLQSTKPYGMSKALANSRQMTLIRLTLENGIQGFGEAWGPPTLNRAYHSLLEQYLLGTHCLDVEHTFDQIIARHYHFGLQNPMLACLSGIDLAAKDAAGKLLGVPVCRLIGGRNLEQVPIYASGGYLTEEPEKDLAPQIDAMANASHQHVKIKIGLGPKSDEARLAFARKQLGDETHIFVDINANYTFDIARAAIDRMAPYQPGWVEEPLSPRDFTGLRKLQNAVRTPIAAGEALFSVHDFKLLIEQGGVDIIQPDLSLCGGFWQGRKIAELAYAHHLRVSPHVWGGAINLAAALHFISALSVYPHAANVPEPVLLEYDLGENPLREELLATPLKPVNGSIAVPDGPGLGIEINWDTVERYAIA